MYVFATFSYRKLNEKRKEWLFNKIKKRLSLINIDVIYFFSLFVTSTVADDDDADDDDHHPMPVT